MKRLADRLSAEIRYPPLSGSLGGRYKGAFVAFVRVILSRYGGGFATILAYLADGFGTQFVSTIAAQRLIASTTKPE